MWSGKRIKSGGRSLVTGLCGNRMIRLIAKAVDSEYLALLQLQERLHNMT